MIRERFHALTLTFDSDFCSISNVSCSNSVQNWSEIKKSAAELLAIQHIFTVQRYCGALPPDDSQGCVGRTVPNSGKTRGHQLLMLSKFVLDIIAPF